MSSKKFLMTFTVDFGGARGGGAGKAPELEAKRKGKSPCLSGFLTGDHRSTWRGRKVSQNVVRAVRCDQVRVIRAASQVNLDFPVRVCVCVCAPTCMQGMIK